MTTFSFEATTESCHLGVPLNPRITVAGIASRICVQTWAFRYHVWVCWARYCPSSVAQPQSTQASEQASRSVCSCPGQKHCCLQGCSCLFPSTPPGSSNLAISPPHSTSWIMKKKLSWASADPANRPEHTSFVPSLMYGLSTNICCGSLSWRWQPCVYPFLDQCEDQEFWKWAGTGVDDCK